MGPQNHSDPGTVALVYNSTFKVAHLIHTEWLQWQKEEHIPEIMSSKLFNGYRLFHLLEQDETEGITYVTQFFTLSAEHYIKFKNEFAPGLHNKAINKWGNHFVSFHTIMEVMH